MKWDPGRGVLSFRVPGQMEISQPSSVRGSQDLTLTCWNSESREPASRHRSRRRSRPVSRNLDSGAWTLINFCGLPRNQKERPPRSCWPRDVLAMGKLTEEAGWTEDSGNLPRRCPYAGGRGVQCLAVESPPDCLPTSRFSLACRAAGSPALAGAAWPAGGADQGGEPSIGERLLRVDAVRLTASARGTVQEWCQIRPIPLLTLRISEGLTPAQS